MTTSLKLDVGSGPYPEPGYTSVDAYTDADVKAEMWDLPFEDNTVDEIRSVHSLEHITKHQVPGTLAEWYRVLKPGGKLHIEVPDLRWCVLAWAENPTDGFELDRIFGLGVHEGEIHKTGFTYESLRNKVTDTGFVDAVLSTRWSHEQDSIECLARKP